MATFPTADWLEALMEKLNGDQQYAQVASKWEGDMLFKIEAGKGLEQNMFFYIDLWHGKCRGVKVLENENEKKASFVLSGSYDNYKRLLNGDIDPMQALLTRKLGVKGNMAVMMRSVPIVLDFVRCCKEVTDDFI